MGAGSDTGVERMSENAILVCQRINDARLTHPKLTTPILAAGVGNG